MEEETMQMNLSRQWTQVNHIAIVVSDVGKSVSFYSNVIGMEQVFRPDFDRYGAWLNMRNVDLHLIKGRPAVHGNEDLIVGHIALEVENLEPIKKTLHEQKIKYRANFTVPNPTQGIDGKVNQIFIRDPDGYYIELCVCKELHDYAEKIRNANMNMTLNLIQSLKVVEWSNKLKSKAEKALNTLNNEVNDFDEFYQPDHQIDEQKLQNLLSRKKVYGDLIQNYEEMELRKLLAYTKNNIPEVLAIIRQRIKKSGIKVLVPPAFQDWDGNFKQPPKFQMSIQKENIQDSKS